MSYVAGVEANSTHPLATAIVAHSSNGGFAPADVDDGSFVQVQNPSTGRAAFPMRFRPYQ
jgi:cation transport ATPase